MLPTIESQQAGPYQMTSTRSERRTYNSALIGVAGLAAFLLLAAASPVFAKKTGDVPQGAPIDSIVALVNDEPITGFELQQRTMMLAGGDVQKKAQEYFKSAIKDPSTTKRLKAILGQTIKANEGKSRDEIIAIFEARKKQFAIQLQKEAVERARKSAMPSVKKQALDELIDEKLKLQEAKRQSITVDDDQINRVLGSIAQRNNLTTAQFLSRLGPGVEAMKDRIRSSLAWADVVRRRYGAQIAISTRDVDELVAKTSGEGEDQVELIVQRIVITTPVKMEQYGIAQRMKEAEQIRSKFTGCKSSSGIAAGTPGARFEELGRRSPSAFQEPTRTLLLNAKDGEILPPTMGTAGIELWIVCGRDVVKADTEIRNKAELELKNREFELLAKRHLKDLRQDAHIEYR
jgi:peptidyl-prolyl cis-trans isomerase SurA